MNAFKNVFAVLFVISMSTSLFAAASEHAPIGVMGDHIHEKGQWMASYRYMRMEMNGLSSRTLDKSQDSVLEQYAVSPRFMLVDKHVFGLMYGLTDNVSLMASLPYISQSMSHNHRSDLVGHFRRGYQGFGDLKTSAIYETINNDALTVLLTSGVSVPMGTIKADDEGHLAYPMQLGSGTLDLLPGVTFKGELSTEQNLTWGSQISAVLRSGYNSQKYRLGNEFKTTGWIAKGFTESLSSSVRLTYVDRDNIVGEDKDINVVMSPAMDPNLRGGERLDLSLGGNYQFSGGTFDGHRIAAEVGVPVYQNLDGPQLKTELWYTLGWQLAF